MKSISHRRLAEMLSCNLRLGVVLQSTYVLGMHVLHHMSRLGTRQIAMSLPDFKNTVLVNETGLPISGPVQQVMESGDGVKFASTDISARYTYALQQLHWFGGVLNDTQESRLDEVTAASVHFTARPELCAGVHWSEKTPVVYRLTSATEADAKAVIENHRETWLTAYKVAVLKLNAD